MHIRRYVANGRIHTFAAKVIRHSQHTYVVTGMSNVTDLPSDNTCSTEVSGGGVHTNLMDTDALEIETPGAATANFQDFKNMDTQSYQFSEINGTIKHMEEEIKNKTMSMDLHTLSNYNIVPISHTHLNLKVEKNIILQDKRTILEPSLIAQIALSINLKANENVLILGAATGYLSAILSHQAETVIVVEENEKLLKLGRSILFIVLR